MALRLAAFVGVCRKKRRSSAQLLLAALLVLVGLTISTAPDVRANTSPQRRTLRWGWSFKGVTTAMSMSEAQAILGGPIDDNATCGSGHQLLHLALSGQAVPSNGRPTAITVSNDDGVLGDLGSGDAVKGIYFFSKSVIGPYGIRLGMKTSTIRQRLRSHSHVAVQPGPDGGGGGFIAPGPYGEWLAVADLPRTASYPGGPRDTAWIVDIVDSERAARTIASAYGIGGC